MYTVQLAYVSIKKISCLPTQCGFSFPAFLGLPTTHQKKVQYSKAVILHAAAAYQPWSLRYLHPYSKDFFLKKKMMRRASYPKKKLTSLPAAHSRTVASTSLSSILTRFAPVLDHLRLANTSSTITAPAPPPSTTIKPILTSPFPFPFPFPFLVPTARAYRRVAWDAAGAWRPNNLPHVQSRLDDGGR